MRRIGLGVHQLLNDGRAQDQPIQCRVSGHSHRQRRSFHPREEGSRHRNADQSVSWTLARTRRSRRISATMTRKISRMNRVPDRHGRIPVHSSLRYFLHRTIPQPLSLLWNPRTVMRRKTKTMDQRVVHTVPAIRLMTVRKRSSTLRTKICLCQTSISAGAPARKHIGLRQLHSRSLFHVTSTINHLTSTV